MGTMAVHALPAAEYTVRDQLLMEHARRYFAWQFAMAGEHLGRRVVEVGCGLGNFTQHLMTRELVVGVDIEPLCIGRHRQRFAQHPNVISLSMDVVSEEFARLREYRPDSVACLNVLEHLREDGKALAHMHRVLPPGGTVVLIVPAFQALYGPIDQRLAHYRRYSKPSLASTAQAAGFRCRALRYFNSAGFFAWWLNARICRRNEQSAAQIRLFDRAMVPVLQRLEHRIEPPFGQSIFAVLERD